MRRLAFLGTLFLFATLASSAQSSTDSCPVIPPSVTLPSVISSSYPGSVVHVARATSPQRFTPYSMVQMRTSVQTLGNGTRITNRNETRTWHAADGKVRTETRFERNGEMQLQNVNIFDPVLQQSTVLHERSRVAEVNRFLRATANSQPRAVDKEFSAATQAEYQHPNQTQSHTEFKNEQLGTSTILGECANGTRNTQIIPAGEQGNDSEIRYVNENWFSPRLGIMLRSIQDDPRNGHTVDEVTELHLEAPDPSLFEPPPGYQVFDLTRDPANP